MKKRNVLLVLAIVLLTIGFAAVSTVLYINGTVLIKANQEGFVNGVVFDSDSIRTSEGTTATVSASGRTLTFETPAFDSIGDSATVFFKIKNNSTYKATLGSTAMSCYEVTAYADNTASTSVTASGYVSIIPATNLDSAVIVSNSSSEESSVVIRQVKSYIGDDNKSLKFQCALNVAAQE